MRRYTAGAYKSRAFPAAIGGDEIFLRCSKFCAGYGYMALRTEADILVEDASQQYGGPDNRTAAAAAAAAPAAAPTPAAAPAAAAPAVAPTPAATAAAPAAAPTPVAGLDLDGNDAGGTKVGRCRLTVSNPELKPCLVSAISA